MSKIKVAETFYALQGEGRYVGTPSVFLRTFGCNLRCKNFGRDKKEVIAGVNPEVAEVIKNIHLYKKLEDLPLVSTGCDSYAAVYPEFKDFSKTWDTDKLVEYILSLSPVGAINRKVHLVVTGGEPLLWQKSITDVIEELASYTGDVPYVTFETNGTKMPEVGYMSAISSVAELHFSVSPKLSCSGESRKDAIKADVLSAIPEYGLMDYKFVVATQADVDEVLHLRDNVLPDASDIPIYLMPVGGLNESYQLNRSDVANLALKYGFKFSPRLQCDVSGNSWGT